MISLGQSQPDRTFTLIAHNVRQQPLFHMGELHAARHHQELGLTLYDAERHRNLTAQYGEDPGVGCLAYGAATLWHLGYVEQSLRAVDSSRKLAEQIADPFSIAQTAYFGAFTHLCRREFDRAKGVAQFLMDLCSEHGFTLLCAGGLILHGRSISDLGQPEEGIEQMRRGLTEWQATGAVSHRPFQLAPLAEILGSNSRVDEALAAIAEALAICAATGERFWEAELHRLKGEVSLKLPETASASAEACFHQAAVIARGQQAKSLELRALVSLCRLPQNPARPDAMSALAETVRWFTEGFDTRDLRDAKTILENPSDLAWPRQHSET